MRPITLFALTTMLACADGTDATTDDTDAGADTDGGTTDVDDTDEVDDDTDDSTDDTDGAGGDALGAVAVGTWTVTDHETACGLSLGLGLVGAAVVDEEDQVALTMTESVGLQQMVFSCTFSDATHYACESESVSSGNIAVCLYQTSLTAVGGTVVDDVGTISIRVAQSAVGPSCPPVAPCSETATATATIGE